MTGTTIRRIRADEGPRLRDVRLRALADAPTAFGSTLTGEQALPDQTWHRRAVERAAGDTIVTFVVEVEERWHGLAGGVLEPDAPGEATVTSMWVDPALRRHGAAAALIDAVAAWARERGAVRLLLWVTATNEPALALYRRSGFSPTGREQPLPSHPLLHEIEMARPL